MIYQFSPSSISSSNPNASPSPASLVAAPVATTASMPQLQPAPNPAINQSNSKRPIRQNPKRRPDNEGNSLIDGKRTKSDSKKREIKIARSVLRVK